MEDEQNFEFDVVPALEGIPSGRFTPSHVNSIHPRWKNTGSGVALHFTRVHHRGKNLAAYLFI